MSKFTFGSYKATVDAENAEYDKKFEGREEEIARHSALIINSDAQVNGSHQLVETEAKKNWITQLRKERKNIFLGKDYMMRAPEFERDDEQVGEGEYMEDKAADEILVTDEKTGIRHVDDEYNPNVTEEALDHDAISKRFTEACIIDNMTAKCIGWDFEDILSECASALEAEFGDDYELPSDLDDLVEASLTKVEQLQLLGHDTGPKLAIPHISSKKSNDEQ